MSDAAAPVTFRARALEFCKGMPHEVRDVCKLVAGDLDDGGPLAARIRLEAPVQGKAATPGTTNRERSMREEFFHAAGLVYLKMISHVDIVSGDVCRDADRSFKGMKLATFAERLGLCDRRVDRCVSVFHRLGLLQTWERAERTAAGYVGHAAVRKLSITEVLCFMGLDGKLTWWKKIQSAVSQERARKARQKSPQEQARESLNELGELNRERRRAPSAHARQSEGFITGAGLAAKLPGLRTGPPQPFPA